MSGEPSRDYFERAITRATEKFEHLFIGGFHYKDYYWNKREQEELDRTALLSPTNYDLFKIAVPYFSNLKKTIRFPTYVSDIGKELDKLYPKLKASDKNGILIIAALCARIGVTTDLNKAPNIIFYDRTLDAPKEDDDGVLDD